MNAFTSGLAPGASHSHAGLASLASAAASGKGGCWIVAGAAGPYAAGLRRAPAKTLVEAVLTVTAPARSRIVLASNPGHHVPEFKIEPQVTWGHQRVLWKFRGNLGSGDPPPAPADDNDDDVMLNVEALNRHMAKGNRRFIANHDAKPWTERLHDLLNQIEAMCGKPGVSQQGEATPKGQGLLIIDDDYLTDGFTALGKPPTDQMRVRDSQRFQALPKLAADSGTMVVVLTALETRARALLGLGRKEDGSQDDEANILRWAIAERAPDEERAKHLREQARAYPLLRWREAHLVHWPSGQRSQPYGEMMRPSDPMEPLYRSLRMIAPAALPSPIQKLDRMIAMGTVRSALEELEQSAKADAKRRRKGLAAGKPQALHACIYGPTGTGKTTVATIIAEIYSNLNLLGSSKITSVKRADLVGHHVGETAIKTRQVCTEALGGVLFIDEAYILAQGGENDFGKEAVAELLPWMSEYHDRLAIIFAGYEKEMKALWEMNSGLKNRIPVSHVFELREYTPKEVAEIVAILAAQDGESLSPDAAAVIETKVAAHRDKCMRDDVPFGNGRVGQELLSAAQRARDARLLPSATAADLRTLRAVDFANARFG